MDVSVAPSQRKRVHLSYDDESDESEVPRAKKARFPRGKKDGQVETSGKNLGVIDGEEDDGPVLSTDPRVAALERATRTDRVSEQMLAENTDDLALAEEDYAEDDEERVEDGMRIEPFNLKQEREEGYFDAEGNYVEYRNENDTSVRSCNWDSFGEAVPCIIKSACSSRAEDAWLESVEVNTQFVGKAVVQPMGDAEDNMGLSKEEVAGIKRRIADALQSRETVLRALRRLKGMAKENDNERMSQDVKIVFDQLTEDAMRLMADGDYSSVPGSLLTNVYEEMKETFQREAEGYQALTRLRSGVSNGAGSSGGERTPLDDSDMFADLGEDFTEQPGPSSDLTGLQSESRGGIPAEDSGYIFYEASGYYYNNGLDYYYDANSGLYCSASTGTWYVVLQALSMSRA